MSEGKQPFTDYVTRAGRGPDVSRWGWVTAGILAVLLIAASLIIGLFPTLLMNWIEPCFRSPLFSRLLNGGAQ